MSLADKRQRNELVRRMAMDIRIGARVVDIKRAVLAAAADRALRRIVRQHASHRRKWRSSRPSTSS